jgi:hypothetical protein
MGHFGIYKTHEVLAAHFFWPQMCKDVERIVARCTTCQRAKSCLNKHGLYMPLLVPISPWLDIEDHVWFEDRWMVASWCDE